MGGSIGYSRGTPTGSTFWAEVATAAPPENAHDVVFQTALPAHADAALEREARVLYVEDNDDNVEVVARALRRLGDRLRLTTAPSLADARVLLETTPFDVLLLDLHLPDGSGLTLARRAGGRGRATRHR
jgi:PleD family two-component response regulator